MTLTRDRLFPSEPIARAVARQIYESVRSTADCVTPCSPIQHGLRITHHSENAAKLSSRRTAMSLATKLRKVDVDAATPACRFDELRREQSGDLEKR